MNTLLIYPPGKTSFITPPLGLMYLGAYLKKAGHVPEILDFLLNKFDEDLLFEKVKKAELIGISAVTPLIANAIKLANLIKDKFPEKIIVLGGPHPTLLPKETLDSCKNIDYIVKGEGEERLNWLIEYLEGKRSKENLDGIYFKKNGGTIDLPQKSRLENLDLLLFPARELVPIEKYSKFLESRKKPATTIITSRGCPYQCNFCFRGVFGNKWRFRSPENVVAEMEILIRKYGAKEIRLWDDTFNADTERVKEICRLIIKKKLKFSWTCLGRVNKADEEMFRLMRKAGCWQISYGIESGNEEILKSLNKGISKKMVEEAIKKTTDAGIQALGFFILGLPGETEITMRETIDFAKSLPLSVANFTIATPYPGTKLWFEAEKRGFLKDVSYDKLLVNLPDKLFYVPEGLTAKKVQEYETKAYREFYRNPIFILRQLRQVNDVPDFVRKVKAFLTIQSI